MRQWLEAVFISSLSLGLFYLAYIGIKHQNIDLKDYSVFKGSVIEKGIGFRKGSKGRKYNCFYIQLKGLDQKLAIYRNSKDYTDLLKAVHRGDTLLVYYEPSNESNNINIDLIQIEKKGKIILPKSEFERKEAALIYLGIVGGILCLFMSYLHIKLKILNKTSKNFEYRY